MNTIYLVRHGENPANLTKEFSHRKVDYSLTPKGIMQAQQTADYFRDKQIHAIYASPLKRAVETATIIGQALGLPVGVIEEFREINVGTLEDQPPSADNWRFHNQILTDWLTGKPEARFPGGEDYFMLCQRMRDGLEAVSGDQTGRNIVIVGHGGIFLTALRDICPAVNLEEVFASEYHNCAVSEITLAREQGQLVGRLVEWGRGTHLSGEAAVLVSPLPAPA